MVSIWNDCPINCVVAALDWYYCIYGFWNLLYDCKIVLSVLWQTGIYQVSSAKLIYLTSGTKNKSPQQLSEEPELWWLKKDKRDKILFWTKTQALNTAVKQVDSNSHHQSIPPLTISWPWLTAASHISQRRAAEQKLSPFSFCVQQWNVTVWLPCFLQLHENKAF